MFYISEIVCSTSYISIWTFQFHTVVPCSALLNLILISLCCSDSSQMMVNYAFIYTWQIYVNNPSSKGPFYALHFVNPPPQKKKSWYFFGPAAVSNTEWGKGVVLPPPTNQMAWRLAQLTPTPQRVTRSPSTPGVSVCSRRGKPGIDWWLGQTCSGGRKGCLLRTCGSGQRRRP